MTQTKQKELDTSSWSDFAGEYLKAEFVDTFPAILVCTGIETIQRESGAGLIALVEYNKRKWKFDLNKTNQSVIRASGIKAPRDIIGKKFLVEKIKVRNPSSNTQVDSLVISQVE